jgi:hypothetical protein
MRLFQKSKQLAPTPATSAVAPTWPDDSLTDIDDDAFARAIAAGREAEKHQLVA